MHRVFVYGSLMKGYHNHRFLRDARFLRRDRTTHYHFRMYSLGSFPAVVAAGGPDAGPVEGELYEVDDQTLAALDRLEGHPSHYVRQKVALEGGSQAWMYLYRGEGREADDDRVSGNDWRANGLPRGHEVCECCGGHGVGDLEPDDKGNPVYLPCGACGGHGYSVPNAAVAVGVTDAF